MLRQSPALGETPPGSFLQPRATSSAISTVWGHGGDGKGEGGQDALRHHPPPPPLQQGLGDLGTVICLLLPASVSLLGINSPLPPSTAGCLIPCRGSGHKQTVPPPPPPAPLKRPAGCRGHTGRVLHPPPQRIEEEEEGASPHPCPSAWTPWQEGPAPIASLCTDVLLVLLTAAQPLPDPRLNPVGVQGGVWLDPRMWQGGRGGGSSTPAFAALCVPISPFPW